MNKATVERLAKSVLSGKELRDFMSDLKNTSEGGGVLHEMHHDLMLKSRSRSPQTKVTNIGRTK
jgi:hypothetical protein